MKNRSRPLIDSLASSILFIGILIALAGVSQTVSFGGSQPKTQGSLTERSTAIDAALKQSEKEYSFTTKFTPGVGVINNPQATLKAWQDTLQPVPDHNQEDVE